MQLYIEGYRSHNKELSQALSCAALFYSEKTRPSIFDEIEIGEITANSFLEELKLTFVLLSPHLLPKDQ